MRSTTAIPGAFRRSVKRRNTSLRIGVGNGDAVIRIALQGSGGIMEWMRKPGQKFPLPVREVLAVLGGVALIAYAIVASGPKEPVYQGKSLSKWVARYQQSFSTPNHWQAEREIFEQAIRAMGTNAIPFAMADVRAQATKSEKVMFWLSKHSPFLNPQQFQDWLLGSQDERWGRGTMILQALGPIANSCLPELIGESTNHPGFSERAWLAVGPAALPAFTNLLIKSKYPQMCQMIGVLTDGVISGRIAPEEAAMAVPCLIHFYHSKNPRERQFALSGMEVICAGSLGLLVENTNAYSALDVMRRREAVRAGADVNVDETLLMVMGVDYGIDGALAVPVLVRELQDKHPVVRVYAAIGLGRLASRPEQSIPALENALQDSDQYVRMMSAESLGQFGPRAASAVAALEKTCSDADASVRGAAAEALIHVRTQAALK